MQEQTGSMHGGGVAERHQKKIPQMRERYKVSAKGSHQNSDSSNNLSSLEFFLFAVVVVAPGLSSNIFSKQQSDKATKRQSDKEQGHGRETLYMHG